METFDTIYLVDLHGNSNMKERSPEGGKDENVFDIKQGVAISLCVTCQVNHNLTSMHHTDVWGEREGVTVDGGKYAWLAGRDVGSTDWDEFSSRSPLHLFKPRDETLSDEYEAAWPIPAIFSPNGDPAPGIVTTHDQFAISWNPDEAVSKVERFLSTESEEEARTIWQLCSQNQWQYQRAKDELADGSWRERIESVLYRPFDIRTTVFDRNISVHRRERVMRHMLAGNNLGLSTTRSTEIADGWEHVFVSRDIIQHHTVSLKEVNYLFPLYIHLPGAFDQRELNLNPKFRSAFAAAINLDFIFDGAGDLTATFGPEDILHYLYAVLHSPEYRRRYADFLKSDFPRLPLTGSSNLFRELARLGGELVALHLLESPALDTPHTEFFGDNRQVRKVGWTPDNGGTVWIEGQGNRANFKPGASGFRPVPEEVWNFHIGGYQVCEKWLKDRGPKSGNPGRILMDEDISHYQKIIIALTETIRLMAEIDEIIESHGGWPDAFVTSDETED